MNNTDEHLGKLDALHERMQGISNQHMPQVISCLAGMAASHARNSTGATVIELFLRYNFGVSYFGKLFLPTLTTLIVGALWYSVNTLFFAPAADPAVFAPAGGVLMVAVLILIPWTRHWVSVVRHFGNTSDQHSKHPGEALLGALNTWLQKRSFGKGGAFCKRALAWICASEMRRDFLGETLAGILIAYLLGWLCFNRYVTDYLLFSVLCMQLKRMSRRRQKIEERRKWNDARIEMEKRNAQ